MDQEHQDRIRQRAHEIWESEGCPEGREAEHWAQAEAELAGQGQTDAQQADPDAPSQDSSGMIQPSGATRPPRSGRAAKAAGSAGAADPAKPRRARKSAASAGMATDNPEDAAAGSTPYLNEGP